MSLLRLVLGVLFACLAFAAHAQNATLTVVNLGQGSVTSSPSGISCNPNCALTLPVNTSVTLTASAATGWTFSSWQTTPLPANPCTGSSTSTTCTFTLTQNTTIYAIYQGIATFTLQDQTALGAGTYQIYVMGYSTAGPYVLNSDGTWIAPTAPTGGATLTVPCWQFPQQITQVSINSTLTAISARVYYFVVTDTTTFPNCAPTAGNTGLFNVPGTFTYTDAALATLSTPTASQVTSSVLPAWTYSEIGTSNFYGTIDLSQVDFFAFPMNTGATVTSGNTPANPTQIGNPLGSDNPNSVVNHAKIRDNYSKFVNTLAEAANNNQNCTQDNTPYVCNYLSLLQNITTSGSQVPLYVVQNPGGYLVSNPTGSLVTNFDTLIGKLWTTTSPPTLVLDSGGAIGGIPEDTFTSSIVSIIFPTVPASTYSVTAMKFTGTAASNNYVAYVISPQDYANGCSGGQIPAAYCTSPATTGYQVFAGAGTLASPTEPPPGGSTFAALQTAGLVSTTFTSFSDYNNLVARLGLLISGAMNRGVALVNCGTAATTQCWQNETYWYPTQTSATFLDITQNLFSLWMHTAKIGGTPMFLRPPSYVKSAGSTPGGGKSMGMAYGFSNDENPTPQVTSPPQPEAPSKMDQTVSFAVNTNTITFGPWKGGKGPGPGPGPTSVTLSVINAGGGGAFNPGGTVTSSPSGIQCEPTCSSAYPTGTQVTLTAVPKNNGSVTWSGGCSGTSTTCVLALSADTTVTVDFGAGQLGLPSPNAGLHVVTQGGGTVTSAPAGINCGTTCSKSFAIGSTVTLSATPAAGMAFAGWSGACAGSTPTCQVTMSATRTVGAAFVAASQYTLTVTGATGGIVTSIPGGIDCGVRCIAGFAPGALVSLIAQPRAGYRFAGWSGACSGTQTCDLTMDASRGVQANFAAIPAGQYPLTVHDFGLGSIISSPPGINCGNACAAAFARGTEVSLFASPAPGYEFAGWDGACTGLGACVVYMDEVAFAYARFTPNAVPPGPPTPSEPIPTLSEWALMLLSLLMLAMARRHLRPRRQD